MEVRSFARVGDGVPVPDLTRIQTEYYRRFLQKDALPKEREAIGLEAVLREAFPITSYDGTMSLEYISYSLGRPRYSPEECRRLRLTYGYPFKVWLRLKRPEPVEEEVYFGEIPSMIGGGEFIINGAERVIVTQLHRSPGVDFLEEIRPGEKKLHSCRIIPERGSWVELNVTKKDTLVLRIDQSAGLAATILLRALSEEYSSNTQIYRAFYPVEGVKLQGNWSKAVLGKVLVSPVANPQTGEVLLGSGSVLGEAQIAVLRNAAVKDVEVVTEMEDPLLHQTLLEDPTKSTEEALLRIYARLRPGNPSNIKKARDLFRDKFLDPSRYRLGRVGRFRLNRKFGLQVPETEMTLTAQDLAEAIRYLVKLRLGQGRVDDIDHLGNRRLRTIDELAADEFRKGLLKLRRTVQERMSLKDKEKEPPTPRTLVNSKTVSSAIEFFFGRGELSQVVDQTNPLSQLTHERRLSALGPGGLNRKRAGFEVRDVHISHYGRICPIETPEGTNIGLIASLSVFANVDPYGFIVTPYRVVKNGRVTGEIVYLRADEEDGVRIAPADTACDDHGVIEGDSVLGRYRGDFRSIPVKELQYMDVSPKQLVGVSAALVPFLEHDDANRALMGSNMQRQAVPLLMTENPIVKTGMERWVAENSGMVERAPEDGVVTAVTADRVVLNEYAEIRLRKFKGLNEKTCLNQRPVVRVGQRVKKGQIVADGPATKNGELALGRNVLVAFMIWEGYNFEDAIIVSERLLKDDTFTSIHIQEFDIEIRETRLGKEEFTRDIPNVPEKQLANLDEKGIVRMGTRVGAGDILVGKVAPKSKTELTPEEKLLKAIFGRAGEDVKNDSLEVPSGVDGIVIDTEHYVRKTTLSEDERASQGEEARKVETVANRKIAKRFKQFLDEAKEAVGTLKGSDGTAVTLPAGAATRDILKVLSGFQIADIEVEGKRERDALLKVWEPARREIEGLQDERDRQIAKIRRGDELPTGVLEMVKVYVATKRNLSVGDKMAGRHGNKGVIAKILPEEDMPFLDDGTPVEMLLNPLGVPSRMNIGQILETHLGWAAKRLGFEANTPVFDGAREEEIRGLLKEAGLPEDGKVTLHDGRTGESFHQKVTVGYLYMLKLHHLVDDKIHARATGPYSLITQQPLGGKARFGGQRFGEMEVWALEAYGAAHVLQELLTVKSDDVEGRTKIYEAMVKGENTLEAGTPVSFEVLTNEIKGLGLNLELGSRKG